MSYRKERTEFINRVVLYGLPQHIALALLREATGLNRRAELACSSEEADRDRVPCPMSTMTHNARKQLPCLCDYDPKNGTHSKVPRIAVQDWQAEERIKKMLPDGWAMLTQGDPRGYTLRVIPPQYAERNAGRDVHNLDSIGVPSGPSRLNW